MTFTEATKDMGKKIFKWKKVSVRKRLSLLKNDIFILARFQQRKCLVGIVGKKTHF